MSLIELKFQKGISNGIAFFNEDDWNMLEFQENDLLLIQDETTFEWSVLKPSFNKNIPEFTLFADPNIMGISGFQEGTPVQVEKYKGMVLSAEKVIIEFITHDLNPEELIKEKNQKNMLEFIQNYYFRHSSEIFWPEMNTELRIQIQDEFIEEKTVFSINPNQTIIQIREETQTMAFNALLLIDKSKSMSHRDVLLKGSGNIVEELYNQFSEGNPYYLKKNYRELSDWFKKIRKYTNKPSRTYESYKFDANEKLTHKTGIGRLDSVVLATLTFFNLKISRGMGEKCSFVMYSDDAKPIPINDKPYIDATEFSSDLCNELIKTIYDSQFMSYGSTNISSGLNYVSKIAEKFQKLNNNPLMILLLTDGRPYPPKLDNNSNVLNSLKELKEELNSKEIPFVLYTMGIGEDNNVDKNLLTKLAKIGKGEFHFVRDLSQLTKWYQKLAQEYSISLNS